MKLYISLILLTVFMFLTLSQFPKDLYRKSADSFPVMLEQARKASSQLDLPRNNFNIIILREQGGILGYEYRYLMRVLGYRADDEFSYQLSKYLLSISEKGEINWQRENSWELDQFGKKTLLKKHSEGKSIWYLFKKNEIN
ncbi:hypothetical protein A2960_01025 [Candidatus Gottesmanbacteria bacterium RIFCSPLOWO2_01_FULL_39_12b]|uniref:Uncharacterized protein n=1 Tax=Candidatus Gottesmanbacteria bacterium RIFCSPLOWO2_01_FULL_39_12b TaxID=1798388 RepID=A0A1F6APZ8_9BACT|nr:MAG: hypothetical protein A2960_01025 [Candidatus Gottesmanbacteria bacterium RIFCSPLOWO2_01_FULL_39_12b]